jgi:CheY-like chemotaxis protein
MAGELILIIEDNEKNRKLCRDVLNVKGYNTIESETAEEGLKLAREKSEFDSDGHPASRNGWYYGNEAASNCPRNRANSCDRHHRIGDDPQPDNNVGRRVRRLSDQADQLERIFGRGTARARCKSIKFEVRNLKPETNSKTMNDKTEEIFQTKNMRYAGFEVGTAWKCV